MLPIALDHNLAGSVHLPGDRGVTRVLNVLNAIKGVPEVCRVFCATANPLQVLVVETDQGGSIVGVVDGFSPKGVEGPKDKEDRKQMLRKFGYKF